MNLLSVPYALGLAVAALMTVMIWKFAGAPAQIVDAPAGKVHCISYTPYRNDETPFDPTIRADPARIEADMKLLSGVTDCVRTYSVLEGLDQVVPIARKYGLKVLLGIWIGREEALNQKQITHAIELARANPKTIKAIIVGNEVLLRGEKSPADLIRYLKEVKTATGLPVTYADVTDFWVKAPLELSQAVDFITIHILPYWENNPTSARGGVAYLKSVLEDVGPMFPGKNIFIGETGFPSAGRERAGAVPSIISEERYLRELAAYAQSVDLDYNLIEAFDQPWKRALEGTAGGHWGVFTTDREPKFSWTGPVSNHPEWRLEGGVSFAFAFLVLAVMAWRGGKPDALGGLATGVAAAVAGSALLFQIEHSWLAWRSPVEAVVELFVLAQSLAVIALVLPELTRGRSGAGPLPIAQTVAWLRAPTRDALGRSLLLGLVQLSVVFSTLVVALGLTFDARYRDFPIAAFGLASTSLAVLALNRGDHKRQPGERREEALFATLLVLTAGVTIFNEGLRNTQALVWAILTLLLALPWLGVTRAAYRGVFLKAAASAKA